MRHDAQTGAIGIGTALGAALPDPHQPATILLLVGLGALIGTAVGRIRRLSKDRTREIAENWSLLGGVIGAALYVAALLATLAAAMHFRIGLAETTIATLALIAGLAGRLAPSGRGAQPRPAEGRTRQGDVTMPNPVIAHYQDARGIHHDVVVRKPQDGTWQVIDTSADKSTVIETLGGNEGRPEAEAIAREYAREQRAAGEKAAAASRA